MPFCKGLIFTKFPQNETHAKISEFTEGDHVLLNLLNELRKIDKM